MSEVMGLEILAKSEMMEIQMMVMVVVQPELLKILMHVKEHQQQILTYDKYVQNLEVNHQKTNTLVLLNVEMA